MKEFALINLYCVKLSDNLVEAEPEFSEPIQNVTVAIGRDAQLSCTVENLGTYRVSNCFLIFKSMNLLITIS